MTLKTTEETKKRAAVSLAAAASGEISMDAAVAVTVNPDWMVFSR